MMTLLYLIILSIVNDIFGVNTENACTCISTIYGLGRESSYCIQLQKMGIVHNRKLMLSWGAYK